MTHRAALIEHHALKAFLPYLKTYVQKGLQEVKLKGEPFKATEKEFYAANVFERVGELDNSVETLRLALSFILDLKNTHEDAPVVYRYHYENFLLRLTGIVDRAHRLVGASLLLDPSRIEKIGANAFVAKSIAVDYPEVHRCLKTLDATAAKHKTLRNEVAHSKAFSTRELGLFSAIVSLNLDMGDRTGINNLMDNYFSEAGSELALLAAEIISGLEALLGTLASIYEHIFAGNS